MDSKKVKTDETQSAKRARTKIHRAVQTGKKMYFQEHGEQYTDNLN